MFMDLQDNLKKVLAGALFIFLMVLSGSKLLETFIDYTNFKSQVPERTIAISAEGKVDAVPDVATLNFSVVSQGKDARTIEDSNTKKMNAVVAFLKEQGISDRDIKTTNYNLNPQYDYNKSFSQIGVPYPIVGYVLTQTLTVKVHELDKIGTILEGAISQGVNESGGVSFDIEDPDELKAQARAEAFAKAREKAEALVAQSGARIGKIVSISENDSYVPYPYAYGMGGGALERDAVPPQIQPGTQDVRITVNVVFELL